MNGLLKTKNDIKNLILPLKALDKVLSTSVDKCHIVFENNEGKPFIGARDASGMILAMYEMNQETMFSDFEMFEQEIGVNDVSEFINIISSFTETLKIKVNYPWIQFSSGSRKIKYKTTDVEQIKKGKKRLKTEILNNDVTFNLSSAIVAQLKSDITIFAVNDTISFIGKQGEKNIDVQISKMGEESFQHLYSNTFAIESEVKTNFKINFPKDVIQHLFSCWSDFNVSFYSGQKTIGEFSYGNDAFNMKFYISPALEQNKDD